MALPLLGMPVGIAPKPLRKERYVFLSASTLLLDMAKGQFNVGLMAIPWKIAQATLALPILGDL